MAPYGTGGRAASGSCSTLIVGLLSLAGLVQDAALLRCQRVESVIVNLRENGINSLLQGIETLAFAILTNHRAGWRLIQDVERAILESYEGLSLAPNQATGGNRGGNEDMTVHAVALSERPALDPYVGTYQRPPNGTAEVRAAADGLVVRGGGAGDSDLPLKFWGPDLTYAAPRGGAAYPYFGMPIEFIRKPGGTVGWIRINGRIAAKYG